MGIETCNYPCIFISILPQVAFIIIITRLLLVTFVSLGWFYMIQMINPHVIAVSIISNLLSKPTLRDDKLILSIYHNIRTERLVSIHC